MISEENKNAVKFLYKRGLRKSEISRLIGIDRKTVSLILSGKTEKKTVRSDAITIDKNLVKDVYDRCNGYVQRTFEVLTEEYNISVGYSTLTRIIRDLALKTRSKPRSFQEPDMPGDEMQHDTSPYRIKINGKEIRLICSSIYLRYSKMRYIKFYPSFTRFKMKCFFHEALTHWGYGAKTCIIDNTNLAVHSGTGSSAIFSREMELFAHQYGFRWKAHAIRHSNRKAGCERNFWTIETNFFPGRTFCSLEDLNKHVFEWATKRWRIRPLSKTKLIPAELFENEKPNLIKIPLGIHEPYFLHSRIIDEYGYISFGSNYFWIPKKSSGKINVLEYHNRIRICLEHLTNENCSNIEYILPPWKTKNQKYFPDGHTRQKYEPRNIKKTSDSEKNYLINLAPICKDYMNFIFSKSCSIKQKHKYTKDVYYLSKKMSADLFVKTISRALRFHIADINAIASIARQILQLDTYNCPESLNAANYRERQSYRDGQFSHEHYDDIYFKSDFNLFL